MIVLKNASLCRSVSNVICSVMNEEVPFPERAESFHFATAPTSTLEYIQSPVQRHRGLLPRGSIGQRVNLINRLNSLLRFRMR
jgi:hypothetical protein